MKRRIVALLLCVGLICSSLAVPSAAVYAEDGVQDTEQPVKEREVKEEVENEPEVSDEKPEGTKPEASTTDDGKTQEQAFSEENVGNENFMLSSVEAKAKAVGTDIKVTNSDGVEVLYCVTDASKNEVSLGNLTSLYQEYPKAVDAAVTGVVTIPSQIIDQGVIYKVTSVAKNGFDGCMASKINLPDTITTIGEYAFQGTAMTNAPNLKNVTTIGKHAFKDTKGIVEPVYITTAMVSIGSEAFKGSAITTYYLDYKGSGGFPWQKTSGDNSPFSVKNSHEVSVIVKDKKTYDTLMLDTSKKAQAAFVLAYEVEVVYRDRDAKEITSIPRHLALYSKPLCSTKKADGNWVLPAAMAGTDSTLLYQTPEIPETYKADYDVWSPSMLGGPTFPPGVTGKEYPVISAQVTSSNTWMYIGGDIADETTGETIGVYLANTAEAQPVAPINMTYSGKQVKASNLDSRTPSISDGEGKPIFPQANRVELYKEDGTHYIQVLYVYQFVAQNVADSGVYQYQPFQTQKNKDYLALLGGEAFPYLWFPAQVALTVDIQPAKIYLDFQTPLEFKVKQGATPTLPETIEIEGNTPGTYTWTDTPQIGTKSYNYIFVPDNLSAKSVLNNTTADNYTAKSKKGSVEITFSEEVPATGVTTAQAMSVYVGESQMLTAAIQPAGTTDTTLVWNSDNPKVASVDNANTSGLTSKIIGHKTGTANIKVTTANGKTATCVVKVGPKIAGITLNPTSMTLERGNEKSLQATVNPSDTIDDKTLTWTSSDPRIATVDAKGSVTAVNVGGTTINVKVGGQFIASCQVTVVHATTVPEDVEVYPDPDTGDKEDIKNQIDAIFETKKKYENLPNESKKEIDYSIVEKLNELLRNFDEVDTKVVLVNREGVDQVSAKNLAEAINREDVGKLISGGYMAEVRLIVENRQTTAISPEELQLLESGLGTWENGSLIDLTLLKMLTDTATGVTTEEWVTELAQPIKITMNVPESIKGKKQYAVLRVHGGVVTELKDEDTNPDTITIFSNRFSTYNIVYSDNAYNVSFDFMGGTFNESSGPTLEVTVGENSLITGYPDKTFAKKDGHVFAGWYTDKEYTKEWNLEQDVVIGNMTLYAKWNTTGAQGEQGKPGGSDQTGNQDKASSSDKMGNHPTGDQGNQALYLLLCLLALTSITVVLIRKRKTDN